MKKQVVAKSNKKLVLAKETVTKLASGELALVAGGRPPVTYPGCNSVHNGCTG